MDHDEGSNGKSAQDGPSTVPARDISFAHTAGGFEIRYSDRVAEEHQDLVDESADWLEDQLGVLNLGQIDDRVLMADGVLTDEIKDGLKAWWAARVEGLDLA